MVQGKNKYLNPRVLRKFVKALNVMHKKILKLNFNSSFRFSYLILSFSLKDKKTFSKIVSSKNSTLQVYTLKMSV